LERQKGESLSSPFLGGSETPLVFRTPLVYAFLKRAVTENDNSYKKRKEYLDERRGLIQAEQNSANQFDKTIITLSAGALGLSIVFMREIASTPREGTVSFLRGSWICFGLSLLFVLLSFLLSQQALRRQREILDKQYKNESDAAEGTNCPARITGYLNWASIIAFMIGVVLLTKFSIENLPS